MRRVALLALGLVVAVPLALGASASRSDAPFPPIGAGQRVAVVVCKYQGSSDPVIPVTQWVNVLNAKVNDYYNTATQNQTSFSFEAVPGVCQFDMTYEQSAPPPGGNNSIVDDPAIVFREGGQAVLYADQKQPGLWAFPSLNRILVIVNKKKRDRSSLPPGILFQTGSTAPKQITVSVVTEDFGIDREGKIQDADISVIAHELGHQLGLPDLYREQLTGSPRAPEYAELWDEMSFDNLQNFSAFSRYFVGWLPASRYQVVTRPTPPGGIDKVITPPLAGGTEALLIPTVVPIAPAGPGAQYNPLFQGYIVEARAHTGLDAAAAPKDESGAAAAVVSFCGQKGLPDLYTDGVLVSATKAPFPGQGPAPPNPSIVQDSRPGSAYACKADVSKAKQTELGAAPLQVGEIFKANNVGLKISVTQKNPPGSPAGSFKVHVDWSSPPPMPNLVATDAWLDSPANGFDSYWTPDNDNDGAPDLFGDPVYTPVSVTLSLTAPPQISFGTATHRLHLKVSNTGNGTATDVRGTAYILGPEIPVSSSLGTDALVNASLTRVEDIHFGDIPAGGSATKIIEVSPAGPFVLAFLVNRNGNELMLADNFRFEPFLAVQTGTGSPYKPIDMTLAVANLNKRPQWLYVSPQPLPTGWTGKLTSGSDPKRSYTFLSGAGSEKFSLHLEPPDPGVEKPGQVREITLTGYMNLGDTYVPLAKIPVDVVLSLGTKLVLTVTAGPGKASLDGVLTYRDGGQTKPLVGVPIRIATSAAAGGKGGPLPDLTATTGAKGNFNVTVTTKSGVKYGAVAQYGGSIRYQAAVSSAVAYSG